MNEDEAAKQYTVVYLVLDEYKWLNRKKTLDVIGTFRARCSPFANS